MHRYLSSYGNQRQGHSGTYARQTGGHGLVNRRGDGSAPVLIYTGHRGWFIVGM